MPIHKEQDNLSTDYVWPGSSVWIKCTEGISFGKLDKNGYNNLIVTEKPDILLMGSSHMEAMEIFQDQTVASRLSNKTGLSVYNIGISGHTFPRLINNLDSALNVYNPQKYVIFEISNIDFSDEIFQEAINHDLQRLTSANKGIIFILQKLPFLRIIYTQLKDAKINKNTIDSTISTEYAIPDYEKPLSYISKICKKHNVIPIIFLQTPYNFDNNGNITFQTNRDMLMEFTKNCQENNIIFVNMENPFKYSFENKKIFTHGFITGKVENGHLNKDGHEIIATTLAKIIEDR